MKIDLSETELFVLTASLNYTRNRTLTTSWTPLDQEVLDKIKKASNKLQVKKTRERFQYL